MATYAALFVIATIIVSNSLDESAKLLNHCVIHNTLSLLTSVLDLHSIQYHYENGLKLFSSNSHFTITHVTIIKQILYAIYV